MLYPNYQQGHQTKPTTQLPLKILTAITLFKKNFINQNKRLKPVIHKKNITTPIIILIQIKILKSTISMNRQNSVFISYNIININYLNNLIYIKLTINNIKKILQLFKKLSNINMLAFYFVFFYLIFYIINF
jgi:hypothetical protein